MVEIKIEEKIQEKVEKYRLLTERALKEISFNKDISEKERKIGEDFLSMATNYYNDGEHFISQNDLLTALASFSYAHAWLDAGVRARIFYAEDDQLFTLPQ
jgi:hypothetical protein